MMAILRVAWLIARKDMVIEARQRELTYTTLFFAVACVMVFAFGLVRDGNAIEGVTPAVLWVTIVFAGTLALGRTFERERQAETLTALLAAPVDRPAIYIGKLLSVLMLLVAIEAVLVPLTALMFDLPISRAPWLLVGLLAAGTIGFTSVGTVFAAMLVRAQSRDVLLPVLLYPIAVPVVIGGVMGTAAICDPQVSLAVARMWLGMLVSFDAVFITLALWTFGAVMQE